MAATRMVIGVLFVVARSVDLCLLYGRPHLRNQSKSSPDGAPPFQARSSCQNSNCRRLIASDHLSPDAAAAFFRECVSIATGAPEFRRLQLPAGLWESHMVIDLDSWVRVCRWSVWSTAQMSGVSRPE